MPRPAKPPMTLKEAKRAYKKEGGFRYTASQMARADRLDAREEQRKKELEKEKQRAENKRKREEKLEKERVVRQKMLEEGRISVEDTWGKVTASQPRLNRFFGQKPAPPSPKSATNTGPSLEKEDMQAREPSIEDQEEKPGLHDLQCPSQKKLADISPAVQGPLKTTGLPSLPPTNPNLCQKGRNDDSPVLILPKSTLSAPSHPSRLRELRPSQINFRRPVPHKFLDETKIESARTPVGTSRPNSCSSRAEGIATAVQQQLKILSPISGSNDISEGSTTEILLPKDELGDTSRKGNKGKEKPSSNQGGRYPFKRSVGEDFTDGIDDETFLMLCATQKSLEDDLSTRENSPTTTSPHVRPLCDSSRCKASPVEIRTTPSLESRTPQSKGLSESFNSVFNEIEDEDLIALAEEVEAEMATPKPTPTIAPVPKKTTVMAPPQSLRSKVAKGTHKSESPGAINRTRKPELPHLKPKGKRRLPWDRPRDDFVDLGPSTQALTLELLEQAEAQMRR